MKRLILAGLLLAALFVSCAPPLQIIHFSVMDDSCGCACLSWETNYEARCKVTYCEGGMCYTSPLEPEFSTLHSYGFPINTLKLLMEGVTITCIGRDGQSYTETTTWPGWGKP